RFHGGHIEHSRQVDICKENIPLASLGGVLVEGGDKCGKTRRQLKVILEDMGVAWVSARRFQGRELTQPAAQLPRRKGGTRVIAGGCLAIDPLKALVLVVEAEVDQLSLASLAPLGGAGEVDVKPAQG